MEWFDRLLRRKVKTNQQFMEPQNSTRKPKPPLTECLAARRANTQRNAQNTKERQLQAGIYEYRWRSSGDVRVCAACAANNGKRFFWTSPPSSGHPGEGKCCPERFCRCTAEAVILGLND